MKHIKIKIIKQSTGEEVLNEELSFSDNSHGVPENLTHFFRRTRETVVKKLLIYL